MDLLGIFQVVSYRTGDSFRLYNLDYEAVDREMHVIVQLENRYKVFSGFDAVIAVIRYLPLLWPFLPIAILFKVLGLGPKIYLWLANNRVLVTTGACRGKSCTLKRR